MRHKLTVIEVRSLDTRWRCASTRSGLGGDGKPWRIGTEGSANHRHAVFLELFVGRDDGQLV